MSARDLSFHSSSTGSILSLKAQTSIDEEGSESDCSPALFRINCNNESMVTLFTWSIKKKKETKEKTEPLTVKKCKCVVL